MNGYCNTCVFYKKVSNINGICTILAGLVKRDTLILDKIDIINKVRKLDETVYSPLIVANTFSCIYYKERLNFD